MKKIYSKFEEEVVATTCRCSIRLLSTEVITTTQEALRRWMMQDIVSG